MNKIITYIKRKPQKQYHSIETLFSNIKVEVSKLYRTELVCTKSSGGSPLILLKNLLAFKRDKNNIYHITGDIHYMAFVTGKRTILTIHDIGSALQGTLFKRLYIKLFWFWFPAIFVKRITVISEFTKKELEQIIPFAKEKIKVIYNPVGKDYIKNVYKFNTIKPTILCLGTKSNKNLERVFVAVTNLNCQLHIIGVLQPQQIVKLEKLKIQYRNSVNLPLNGIVEAYKNCDMLCFPSTYEGFGMPIIEAQSIGRPVLTSNIGAMAEVSNDSACLVNPYDSLEIKKGINQIILDKEYRDNLIEKGFENIKRFQLNRIVKQYNDLYKELSVNVQ
ncbi:glycosyltransferase family 4 protein [Winogradskyella costae]|uniref:glycosyltransferase family 4 protein n=1 Tax=Winogradskyella costae TaxID=2697008 RepID=UPI0015CA5814|nr:glycosyltransferase family 1 protein [Winogradskyella costae]